MFDQTTVSRPAAGDAASRPASRLLRLAGTAAFVGVLAVWALGSARIASAAVLESMALYSQVTVNFNGSTSDLLDTTVTGPFDESIAVNVPSPESNGRALAEGALRGSATDTGLTLSGGGSIGNFEADGGSSAFSRTTATAVYTVDAATPFTLQMPSGFVSNGIGIGGSQLITFVDAEENEVVATASGIGETTARFWMNAGENIFANADGTFASGTILSGTLEPGTYTLRYEGEMFGTGEGGYGISDLVVTVPEPSAVAGLAGIGGLLACRRRRG